MSPERPRRTEPASSGQRLLWMLDHHRGSPGSLNCPLLCRFHGPLAVGALERAVTRLTARHETLRTSFTGAGRRLTQVINAPRPVEVASVDLRAEPDPEAALRDAIATELRTPIDVGTWPTRVTLWRLGPAEHALCVNVHHMVTDAWSCGVIFRELTQLYGHATNSAQEPEPPAWQYRRWMRQQAAGERAGWPAHRTFWRDALAGTQLPALDLGGDEDAPGRGAARTTARAVAELDRTTAGRLERLARSRKVSLFAVMLAAYYALLHEETGQQDLAVASLFANRGRSEVQRTVGFLANLVVLRTAFDASEPFTALVDRVGRTVTDAMVHQELPYHLLPANVLPAGDRRVDDVVFQMLPGLGERARLGELTAEVLVPDAVVSRFDLELTIIPHADGLTALLQYAEQRVAATTAQRLITGFARIAAAAAAAPGEPLAPAVAA
jgi:hypothetical protein